MVLRRQFKVSPPWLRLWRISTKEGYLDHSKICQPCSVNQAVSRRYITMTPELERRVFRDLSYGLYIVTSRDEDRLNGQIVNTVIQVTSNPARVAVIINKKNLTHEYISKSGVFAVSVLEESAPMAFFGPFGFRSGRDIDKLSRVQFKKGGTGCPLVTEHTLSVLEVTIIDQIDLGTHTIFIGDAVSSEFLKEGRPLTYRYYHEHLKGKPSKNAPTYNPVEQTDNIGS